MENINTNTEIMATNENNEAITTAAAITNACHHHHHRSSKKNNGLMSMCDTGMLVGFGIGCAISTPIAVVTTNHCLKKKWLKVAADFDKAAAAGATA